MEKSIDDFEKETLGEFLVNSLEESQKQSINDFPDESLEKKWNS